MDADGLVETERDRVIEAVTLVFVETDRRDWAAVQSGFASSVFFDLSALGGGKPGMTSPQEIARQWKDGLKDLKGVHHQVGNFLVHISGEAATVFCYGITFHSMAGLPSEHVRTFVGSYEIHLVKQQGSWRIDTLVYHSRFVTGEKSPQKS